MWHCDVKGEAMNKIGISHNCNTYLQTVGHAEILKVIYLSRLALPQDMFPGLWQHKLIFVELSAITV